MNGTVDRVDAFMSDHISILIRQKEFGHRQYVLFPSVYSFGMRDNDTCRIIRGLASIALTGTLLV